MTLSAKAVRTQLQLLKPIVSGLSLKTIRKAQNKIGELSESRFKDQVIIKEHSFEQFDGAWVIPKDERRQGVIMYIHGGGYTCGNISYSIGFGSMLAHRYGVRVFCPAYRLAPEHPFPAAVDDVLEAYLYLLAKGYSSERITLCGESAGGGLCYSLCVKLRDMDVPPPCCIIAMSPWTDLTSSGKSYEANRDVDPSMTIEKLRFFADSYVTNKREPLASPLFASLYGMPPSLIFVGGDEIMLDDSVKLHEKLIDSGTSSKLIIAPDRWHAYLLYGLKEDKKDFSEINRFLNEHMGREQKLRWMPLDNAAKIYPAARRQNWSNVFRVSSTLTEEIDRKVMQSALDVTVRRFPAFAVRLRRGVFWYYLEQLSAAPDLMDDMSYPLTGMSSYETSECAFRVLIFKNRVAVEIFHSITDGNGALIFLKTLVAEYLHQKYSLKIPAEHGVLGRLEEPSEDEFEDSFLKYAGNVAASRNERTAWHMPGTPLRGKFRNLVCLELPTSEVIAAAKRYGVSVTVFLCAVQMMALQNMQRDRVPAVKRRRPIKILIPVNLRKLFDSRSLRNFVLYTTPEIRPSLGEYTFEEICTAVKHHLGLDVTPKQMSMKIATNVNSEKHFIVRIMPLFIKNFVMKTVYDTVGERKSCLTLSNLGAVVIPDIMKPYVERFDFILGVQASSPNNCGVLSYGDTVYMNLIRNIKESEFELQIHSILRDLGITGTVRSNNPN